MLGVEGGYANCYNDLCQKIVFVHRLMSVCASYMYPRKVMDTFS